MFCRHLPVLALAAAASLAATPSAQEWFRDARKSPMPLSMAETEALFPADMDGDGLVDLLVANAFRSPELLQHNSRVLLNRGAGRFENITPPARQSLFFLAAGDMDGDGDVDAVYRSPIDGDAGIAVNDGTGVLTAVSTVPMAGWRAVVGDVNGDATLDVFTGYGLHLNQGGLVFSDVSATLPPLGLTAQPALGIADLDEDGDLDLVVGDRAGQTRLLLNDGLGAFTDATATHLPPDGDQTFDLVVSDIDLDGDLDLVLGNYDAISRVYLNSGVAVFTATDSLAFQAVPTVSLAVGDVTGDGSPDIVFGHEAGGSLAFNLGGNRFTPAGGLRWRPGPRASTALVLTDVDGDGDRDLLQGSGEEPVVFAGVTDSYGVENRVFFNDGQANFVGAGQSSLPDTAPEPWAAIGDFDGDGSLDVLYGGEGGRIWFNDGWGEFARTDLTLPVAGAPIAGDVDGDGDEDVVLLEAAGGFHVLDNPGDGRLWPVQTVWLSMLPPGVEAQAAVLSDLDGDGDLDVFVATGGIDSRSLPAAATDALWLNDGQGVFSDGGHLLPAGVLTSSWDVAVGDVDGDTASDVVTGGGTIYLDRSPGPFVAVPFHISWNQGGTSIALGDMDGDDDLDVVAGNACRGLGCAPSLAGGPNVIHWNDGSGGFLDSQVLPETSSTMTTSVAVNDVDADGDLDIVFGQVGVTGTGHDNLAENLLFLNDGARVFRRVGGYTRDEFPLDWDDTNGLAMGDVDRDGDADLLVFNQPVDVGQSPRHKVHAGLIRHLWAPYFARQGRDYALEIHGVDYGATVLVAFRPAEIPAPPFGTFGLDPATSFLIGHFPPPPVGRRVDSSFCIPAGPALAGLELSFQAIVWGLRSRLTNRVADTIYAH